MPKDYKKLIVALDLEDRSKILKAVRQLAPRGAKFKIGSIAFTKFGPGLVKSLTGKGVDVFLDLKLHDIPNTMRQAAKVIAEMGVWAFTVHIKAGQEALSAVRKEIRRTKRKRRPLILGVSELTSSKAPAAAVLKLVKTAEAAGLDGVISSAHEAKRIKKKFKLKVITPGIRSSKDKRGDQKRVATAEFAFSQGADYIVVGRPIIGKKNYLLAAEELLYNR